MMEVCCQPTPECMPTVPLEPDLLQCRTNHIPRKCIEVRRVSLDAPKDEPGRRRAAFYPVVVEIVCELWDYGNTAPSRFPLWAMDERLPNGLGDPDRLNVVVRLT